MEAVDGSLSAPDCSWLLVYSSTGSTRAVSETNSFCRGKIAALIAEKSRQRPAERQSQNIEQEQVRRTENLPKEGRDHKPERMNDLDEPRQLQEKLNKSADKDIERQLSLDILVTVMNLRARGEDPDADLRSEIIGPAANRFEIHLVISMRLCIVASPGCMSGLQVVR